MKFTYVTFSEPTEVNHAGGVLELEADTPYKFPLQRAEKLAEGTESFAGYEEVFEVPKEEVADTVGEKADSSSNSSNEGNDSGKDDFLQSRTVGELENDVENINDVQRLEKLSEQAERKGVAEAIANRLEELDNDEEQ